MQIYGNELMDFKLFIYNGLKNNDNAETNIRKEKSKKEKNN